MRPSRFFGGALIALSLLSVLDTILAVALPMRGSSRYDKHELPGRRLAFAGHRIALEDDQPSDSVPADRRERETPGMLTVKIDGRAVGAPARVGVRRGRPDDGRYFSWFDARVFKSRATGDSSLWLARRADVGMNVTRYEITELRSDGSISTRILHGWELGWDFRALEATRYLVWDTLWPFPFEASGAVLVPFVLLFCPIGTFVVGVVLWRRGRAAVIHRAAA